MSEEKEMKNRPSRRSVLKGLVGLFAFIPAAKFLADASPAFARAYYECEYTNCWPCNPQIGHA